MRPIDADALIQSLEKKHEHWHELVPEENKEIEFAHSYALNVIRNAPTADAKPTVIQSKTLFPTKDFMEWAKRIKEVNPNAVVIPCDAEVVSADSVQGWIPVRERLPKENGEYIVSLEDSVYPWAKFFNGKWFMLSINAIAREFGEYEVLAWMPLPETYREDGE